MNNQFATQFLLEDREELKSTVSSALQSAGASDDYLVKILTDAVMNGILTLQKALEIVDNPHIDEMDGGGSTTGGGTTAGASFTPGAGEQMATTKAFKGTRKKKYQEGTFEDDEIAIYDGKEDGLTKIYKRESGYYGVNDNFDFTAKDRADLLRKLKEFGYTLLAGSLEEDAPRLAGNPAKTTSQGAKNLSAYSSVGFTKAPSAEEAGKKIKGVQVKMLWKEGQAPTWEIAQPLVKAIADRYIPRNLHAEFFDHIKDSLEQNLIKEPQDVFNSASNFLELYKEGINESRAYSQFKKQTAIRPKSEQMHEAVKMIHKKLEEVSKLVEYAQQMRAELSEGENTLEYKHNTKKIFEKINSKVVEVYTKTRNLK